MCGCGQVGIESVPYHSSLEMRSSGFRGCMVMYDEVYSVINKVTTLLDHAAMDLKKEHLYLDIHQQLYYWLRRLERECPPEDDYKDIKNFVEDEYSKLKRK